MGHYTESARHIACALSLDRAYAPAYQQRIFLLRTHNRDPRGQAYQDLVTYYRLSGDIAGVYDDLSALLMIRPITQAEFSSYLLEAPHQNARISELRELFAFAMKQYLQRQASAGSTLRENLQAIMATCRKANVQLLLLTYPRDYNTNQIIRAFSAFAAISPVDVEYHLERTSQRLGVPVERFLFVDGGHANDLGYREMAQLIAERLKDPSRYAAQ